MIHFYCNRLIRVVLFSLTDLLIINDMVVLYQVTVGWYRYQSVAAELMSQLGIVNIQVGPVVGAVVGPCGIVASL